MRIHINGAARTVTGSQYLLEVNGSRLLMECGLFQGHRKDTYERNRNFRFEPSKLGAVLLSHAHIDHSGNLPNLVKQGFSGPIYTTAATADLADAMLRDSGHIQEDDAEYINKKRARRGEPPIEPIYTERDAEQVTQYFHPVAYAQKVEVAPGVEAEWLDAGHILGSAAIHLHLQENGRKTSLWFSGDIGRRGLPILRDPVMPYDAENLMMECTYGDTSHDDPAQAYSQFKQVVTRTLQRGGKVIIPAFAVGRTQELVYVLNEMKRTGELGHVPVYVDSPLAVNATRVFKLHPECYDKEMNQVIHDSRHPALEFDGLTYITAVEESKALNGQKGPMIIISASGMAEAGRILHHLKNNIEDANNTVMIVGWQAPDTLGRRITEKQPFLRIYGEQYALRADVEVINGLSAHAGQDKLVEYAKSVEGQVKQLILVHGEEDASGAFQDLLAQTTLPHCRYPELYEIIEL
jgi:metallo-beta-lactamase family protein